MDPVAIAECGGRLQGSGSFSSPNYPNYYHDNAYCVWHISAPSQQQVVLTITDVQLENCCSCDYIAVYDGPSLSSQPLGKLCYNNITDYFHSSSNYLTVLFRSDRSVFRNGRIVYTNGVRAYRSQSGEITRQSHFTLQVLCRMEQDSTAQIMYVAREDEAGNITGSGRFNLTMGFFTSGNFYYPVYDSPYVVTLNQYLYVQVKLRRSDSSLVLFLDTCVASPSPHDFHTRSYDLVRNGCRRDSTYYQYSSGTRDVAQFRFQAFTFMRSHSAVYLQCKVAICRANDYNSRCSQGCRMRKTRSLRSTANTETATVTLGPIQLRDLKKPEVGLPEEGVVQTEV
ncbi:deleted in malignant brain tumors 1 protein-like [Conger conger]|uniref:deleted in malignant brain tumors 1 protein-like n=1 Tax=Conger conger TaxID=82655 RepID=UPI002A5A04F2|nr:deleted in malignant brain tumors 1 protein-like [Conger conger]